MTGPPADPDDVTAELMRQMASKQASFRDWWAWRLWRAEQVGRLEARRMELEAGRFDEDRTRRQAEREFQDAVTMVAALEDAAGAVKANIDQRKRGQAR